MFVPYCVTVQWDITGGHRGGCLALVLRVTTTQSSMPTDPTADPDTERLGHCLLQALPSQRLRAPLHKVPCWGEPRATFCLAEHPGVRGHLGHSRGFVHNIPRDDQEGGRVTPTISQTPVTEDSDRLTCW